MSKLTRSENMAAALNYWLSSSTAVLTRYITRTTQPNVPVVLTTARNAAVLSEGGWHSSKWVVRSRLRWLGEAAEEHGVGGAAQAPGHGHEHQAPAYRRRCDVQL